MEKNKKMYVKFGKVFVLSQMDGQEFLKDYRDFGGCRSYYLGAYRISGRGIKNAIPLAKKTSADGRLVWASEVANVEMPVNPSARMLDPNAL